MLSHGDIWWGIDRLAADNGFSPSGLARRAGLDPTSFNISKRINPHGKPRWPTTESISKILEVTQSTLADFVALIGPNANLSEAMAGYYGPAKMCHGDAPSMLEAVQRSVRHAPRYRPLAPRFSRASGVR